MQKTALAKSDFVEICTTLYAIAQRHIPNSAMADVSELAQIAKIFQEQDIALQIAPKITAHVKDYSSSVVKQSAEYRLIRARYAAALGTIADMGSKIVRKNKSEFHAGITEGLRRAAKIAIMFLEDLDQNIYSDHTYVDPDAEDAEGETVSVKSRSSFVR